MTESTENLEQVLRRQAQTVTEKLREEPSTLAVLLSGPLALGKASEKDKLYFAVITDNDDGIIEHHFLEDGWAGVSRPIEMGKFPMAVAQYLVEHGYSDMVSYKSLEAFRCGQVLFERDNVGSEIIEGSKRHIPEVAFIGESLHGAVSALDDAVSMFKNGDYGNAVFVAREAAMKAAAMALADDDSRETGSILDRARMALSPKQYAQLREVLELNQVGPAQAEQYTRLARQFAEYVLTEMGVNPDHILDAPSQQK